MSLDSYFKVSNNDSSLGNPMSGLKLFDSAASVVGYDFTVRHEINFLDKDLKL